MVDPSVKRGEDIVRGVHACGIAGVTEIIGADTAAAMRHAGNHEEAVEIDRVCIGVPGVRKAVEKRTHALVVFDRTQRRNGCVGPAVILDQLAAVVAKRTQIGIGGVQHCPSLCVAELDIGVEIQRAEIPVRLFENGLPVIGVSETCLHARRQNPG